MTARGLAVLWGLLAVAGASAATNDLSPAEIQGRELARQILSAQVPATNFTQTGTLRIRPRHQDIREIPLRFEIQAIDPATAQWQGRYETAGSNPPVRLTIVHDDDRPNRYQLDGNGQAKDLTGDQTAVPFAGSDFWIGDLGLEFLHWPDQKFVKRLLRNSRDCSVLESLNPSPGTNAYSRVVSWVDRESLGILHAEAYDARGNRLKEYDTKSLRKVNGRWQVKELEIENDQTGSRTWLEFDLKQQ